MTSDAVESLLSTPKPVIMGIVNTTPDSFSDGGQFVGAEEALEHAARLLEGGAAVIDIGGESTGPGSKAVSAQEEWARIGKVVEKLALRCVVSVDTFKSKVAEKALNCGASIINDVSALRFDPNLGRVAAEHDAFVVLMHSKEADQSPHASAGDRSYANVIDDIAQFLSRAVDRAASAGIGENRIILDPGMGGFLSRQAEVSWELVERLEELCSRLPFPFLISASRKGFLGGALADRDPLSALVHLAAIVKGAKIIRTHNAALTAQFIESWKRLSMF